MLPRAYPRDLRARIRVTCARASARPAPARVPARRSAKRAGRAGGWDPIQRARRFMTRAVLPFGIPLIPLNPAESRIPFKFCPSWKAEPDRDTVEKCGLVSCSRSFYPCARRPRHVMAGLARTCSGYPAIHVLSSVRRAWLLEMPGTSPGMTACGSGRSERPRTGPTTCKRTSETRPYGCGPKGASFNSTTSWVSTDGRTLPAKPMNASLAKSLAQ